MTYVYPHRHVISLVLCRLHLKQPSIPVLFLTEATTPAYALAVDVRNHTVYDAVAFAKAQNFIVSQVQCVYALLFTRVNVEENGHNEDLLLHTIYIGKLNYHIHRQNLT